MRFEIDHIALKVGDIDNVLKAFQVLGDDSYEKRRYKEVFMDIAFIGEGAVRLELLTPTDPLSPIAGDPDGLHHIGIKVADIENTYKVLSADSAFIVEGNIRMGAHSRIFFFRLSAEPETLYECVESKGNN